MKATYFPFTYISEPVVELLADCFGQLIVYRPSREKLSEQLQAWVNRGNLEIRVPNFDHEKELNTAIKSYLSWADLHRDSAGEMAAILRAGTDPIPFFNEISARNIVADIKGSAGGDSRTEDPDLDLTARIFMYFAQEFDRHNQELTDDLNHQQEQEAELIRQLKMENDPAAAEFENPSAQLPEPFADYMIPDRLETWTRIFCGDPEASGFLVTNSAAAIELLLERTSAADRIEHLATTSSGAGTDDALESRHQNLASELARLLEQNQVEKLDNLSNLLNLSASNHSVAMSFYLVPNQSPYEFFARSAGIDLWTAASLQCTGRYKNTLIALVRESRNI